MRVAGFVAPPQKELCEGKYDARGQVVSETDALGKTYRFGGGG